MRIHIFQHEASCGPGSILEWMARRELEPRLTRFHLGDGLPDFADVDALVILGGAMNVYHDADFPFLKPLRAFTREALCAHKKVLGLCLGAQLIAEALGSRVVRAPQIERGWIDIIRRDEAATSPLLSWLPPRQKFVSWHGDTFALPQGAVDGATSEAGLVQAFSWNENALALQFHPEADEPTVFSWIADEPASQQAGLRSEFLPFESRFTTQKQLLFAALDAWSGASTEE